MSQSQSELSQAFMSLPDSKLEVYLDKAYEFLQGTGRAWSEENNDAVLFITAFYLCHLDAITVKRPRYPYYSVHCQDDDWRFETGSARLAFAKFKAAIRDNKRVGLFHWERRGKCVRTHATDDYSFERDFGAVN